MASTQVEGAAGTKAEESIEVVPPPKIMEEKEEAEVVVHEVDEDEDKLPDEEEVENAEKDHQIASPLIEGEPDPDASFEDDDQVEAGQDGDQLDDD